MNKILKRIIGIIVLILLTPILFGCLAAFYEPTKINEAVKGAFWADLFVGFIFLAIRIIEWAFKK